MNTKKPILIVAAEPFSVFSEILFKTFKKHKLKRPLVVLASYKIFKKQMNYLKEVLYSSRSEIHSGCSQKRLLRRNEDLFVETNGKLVLVSTVNSCSTFHCWWITNQQRNAGSTIGSPVISPQRNRPGLIIREPAEGD